MSRISSGKRLAAVTLVLAGAVAGCTSEPIGPGAQRPSYLISDAVHSGGKPHFYFLAPMVPSPVTAGVFDPGLQPEVSVCRWAADACAEELARFTMTGGAGSETVRVSAADEHYIVNWHTDGFTLSATSTYRIRIFVGAAELGFADVDVVSSGRELRNVNTGEYIPLLDGRTLPIKFRIEAGFLARIDVVPVEATAQIGATLQFAAELYDLHGQLLAGPPVTWSSSDLGVATVDGGGLASAVSDGEATIAAAAAGISGSATLTVEGGLIFTDGGSHHSCALNSLGQAYCWGLNSFGQLGNGTTTSSLLPVAVTGGHVFTTLTSSLWHTCGLTAGGEAWCWGLNGDGQLGDGATGVIRTAPVLVRGSHVFRQVSASHNNTCGVTTAYQMLCWGRNGNGQLGNGSFSPLQQPVPAPVAGVTQFTAVGAGHDHACGIATSGQAFCWGLNNLGQAGDGSLAFNRLVPTPVVAPGITWTSMTTGQHHNCAVATTGQMWCWGFNGQGQIGDGTQVTRRVPVPVIGGSGFTAMTAGHMHTCALDGSAQAWCWGYNAQGQLGDGTIIRRLVPTPVLGGLTFQSVAGGQDHTCGITLDRAAYCWGANTNGQLGDGTLVQRLVPTAVVGP